MKFDDVDAETQWLGEVLNVLTQAGKPTTREALEHLRDQLTDMVWREGAPRAERFRAGADDDLRLRRHPLASVTAGGCSALLMYWPPGHATLPHDHDGLWGIELVLDGTLAINEYLQTGRGVSTTLAPTGVQHLGVGDAALFKGQRYVHRCRNLSNAHPTLTLHVYGGELRTFTVWDNDANDGHVMRRITPRLDRTLLS
jgi:predicted metal-dependent enzyme (double-stranded beta helix superfamily)